MTLEEKYDAVGNIVNGKTFAEFISLIGDKATKGELWVQQAGKFGRLYWSATPLKFSLNGNSCSITFGDNTLHIGNVTAIVNENMLNPRIYIEHLVRFTCEDDENAEITLNGEPVNVFGAVMRVRQFFDNLL